MPLLNASYLESSRGNDTEVRGTPSKDTRWSFRPCPSISCQILIGWDRRAPDARDPHLFELPEASSTTKTTHCNHWLSAVRNQPLDHQLTPRPPQLRERLDPR